jgi:hypothetical protein
MFLTVIVCTACGLKLEIGWYPGIPAGQEEPLKRYTWRTHQICKECGAQYMIEMAGPKRICAYMHPLKDYSGQVIRFKQADLFKRAA